MPAIRAKLASDRVVTTDFALAQRQQGVNGTIKKPVRRAGTCARGDVVQSRPGERWRCRARSRPAAGARCRAAVFDRRAPRSGLALHDLNLTRRCTTGCQGSRLDRPRPAGQAGRARRAGRSRRRAGPNAVYAIDARIEAGQTSCRVGISQPDQLQGIGVRSELTSPDATELLRAFGIEAPALPPIQTAGKVIRNDQVWQLNDASAQVGESNLAGRLSVDLSSPVLSSAPTSIGPAARAGPEGDCRTGAACRRRWKSEGRRPGPASPTEGSAPLLTAAGINFDALPKVDIDAKFRGSNLEAPEVQLAQLEFDLKLRDGSR